MATDSQMLRMLLDDERLSDDERSSFEDMDRQLSNKGSLTRKQHQWVESRYKQLGLDAQEPSENLVSSGKVKKGGKSDVTLPWEVPGYVKPLKPPGRR
jgi:hypothetical protein